MGYYFLLIFLHNLANVLYLFHLKILLILQLLWHRLIAFLNLFIKDSGLSQKLIDDLLCLSTNSII